MLRWISWAVVKLSGLLVVLYHRIAEMVKRFDKSMQTRYRPRRLALVAVLVIAGLASVMLFVPPYLGLLNDGSFDAVLADVGLARLDPQDTSTYFNYYEREYLVGASNAGTGNTPLLLQGVVRVAILLDELVTRDGLFDLRFLAGIYLAVYLVLIYQLLSRLLTRIGMYAEGLLLSALAVLIFGDSTMITRFASFYTQPLELLLLIGIGACVQSIPQKLDQYLPQILMAGLVILLMSVNQYCAVLGLMFSLAYWLLIRFRADARHQALYALLAIVLCAVSVVQTGSMLQKQTENEKFDQMTRGVLFQAKDPEKALAQFGIDARYSVLTDVYATQSYPLVLPESGALDEGFLDQYTTMDVLLYYFRHPNNLMGMFEVGVSDAFVMRTDFSGNYEKSAGMPEKAKTLFMALWSTFKEQSAPQTAASLLLMAVAFLIFLGKNRKKKGVDQMQESAYSTLGMVMFLSVSLELMTVLVMSGDSLLIRETFLMGCLIDQMALMVCAEAMRKIEKIETQS